VTTLLQRLIKIEQNIEDSIEVWVKGHAFTRLPYGAKCVGCGEFVQTTQGSPSAAAIKKAALARNDLEQCHKPWSLKKRIQELRERQRAAADQSKTQASEITLESVNAKLDAIDAKLDRIIRHWRIYG
jgi:hypothetical protein